MYKYIDDTTPAQVTSKILLYSRDMQIDKIAEIIGGKDDRGKVSFVSLNHFDFRESF
jgi:hypothetical protein